MAFKTYQPLVSFKANHSGFYTWFIAFSLQLLSMVFLKVSGRQRHSLILEFEIPHLSTLFILITILQEQKHQERKKKEDYLLWYHKVTSLVPLVRSYSQNFIYQHGHHSPCCHRSRPFMSGTGTIKKKRKRVFLKFLSNGVEGLFSCLFWTENRVFSCNYLLYTHCASRLWNIDLQEY